MSFYDVSFPPAPVATFLNHVGPAKNANEPLPISLQITKLVFSDTRVFVLILNKGPWVRLTPTHAASKGPLEPMFLGNRFESAD